MKKLIPFIIIAIAVTTFSSCKKEYTCTCTVVSGKVRDSVIVYDLGKLTPRAAKRECKGKRGAIYGKLYDCNL